MRAWERARHSSLLTVLALAGCLGVPEVHFDSDGGLDATPDHSDDVAPSDVGAEAPTGAEGSPGTDATSDDGGSHEASCPASLPPGAAACCDTVPCRGSDAACQGECTNCKNDCPGQTCCLDKHGNFQGCAKDPNACP